MFIQQIPSKIFRGGSVVLRVIPRSDFGPPDALIIEDRCTDSAVSLFTKLARLVRNGILIRPGIESKRECGDWYAK